MIQKTINSLKGKLTIVAIAHRIETLCLADEIYLIKDKVIIKESELSHRQSSHVGEQDGLVEAGK
jgi:ABC-type multidrug transport system fused ATPase/permease subunit